MKLSEDNFTILSWDKIEQKEDFFITFLLYKEGKSINLISRIRNINEETVQKHIINAKFIFKNNNLKKREDLFIELLASTKEQRIEALSLMNSDEKKDLAIYLVKKIPTIKNADDMMIALWIAGELKENILLPVIHIQLDHRHGGVRRMVCSALGKINSVESIDVLHKALQDVKPQVRQYASKALKQIGNEKTILKLNSLLNNPRELEYVRRSHLETIEYINKFKYSEK